jgi:hypothetical protein
MIYGLRGLGASGPTGGVARMSTSRGSIGNAYSGSYDAYPGDSWTVSISGALPNVPVMREHPIGASDVQVGSTDGKGNFSTSGTFTNSDVGQQSDAWSAGGWASGTFRYAIAPALGGTAGGPLGPQFDLYYQGGGYYNTLAMPSDVYAQFDAVRNAGPRVTVQTPAPPPGSVATDTPQFTTSIPGVTQAPPSLAAQLSAAFANSANLPTASASPNVASGFSLSSIPWWGWLVGAGAALYALKGGK